MYLYCTAPIDEEARRALLVRYCTVMEIGNHYWEYEDNCTFRDGVDLDLLHRDLDGFAADMRRVVEGHEASLGYTTCMWHNLRTCKVVFDRHSRLEALNGASTCRTRTRCAMRSSTPTCPCSTAHCRHTTRRSIKPPPVATW